MQIALNNQRARAHENPMRRQIENTAYPDILSRRDYFSRQESGRARIVCWKANWQTFYIPTFNKKII